MLNTGDVVIVNHPSDPFLQNREGKVITVDRGAYLVDVLFRDKYGKSFTSEIPMQFVEKSSSGH